LRPLNMELLLRDNQSVTTHTGTEPPYGYVDWWPTALFVNHEAPPFDEVDVRWAISNFIDREQIIEVGYAGAGSFYPLPVPSYPGLVPFVDNVRDILEEYDTLQFDPDRGAELLQGAGFEKNGDGFWERDGQTLQMTINGWTVFADIGPIIAEQLRQQGVDAEYAQPPNWSDMLQQGDYETGLAGHGGSVSGDPYFTLRLFQSVTVAVPGAHLVNFTKWVNEDYDAIVDEMAVTSLDDTEALMDQFRRAMEIWIPELPNIQIQEWYHRIPMNQTYWVGWPTQDDPYVNGAFWHLTFQLVINRLDPAQ
jgi:peptide/nickel transport system substrate-binding protein